MQEERQFVEKGSRVLLRRLTSFYNYGGRASDQYYTSEVLEVGDLERFKLTLPREYGEIVPLSLDAAYEIVFPAESGVYRGRGRVLERFRDEDGNACLFQLTDSLSRDAGKQYLASGARIAVDILQADVPDTITGIITWMTMKRLILQTDQYLEDGAPVTMVLCLDPAGNDSKVPGIVQETIRLRNGKYESRISMEGDLTFQKELARWILRATVEQDQPEVITE